VDLVSDFDFLGWLDSLGVDTTPRFTIEPCTGSGAYGDVFGAPTTVAGFLSDQRRRVRNTATGEELLSPATLYVELTVTAPAGSRVTLPDGRTTAVAEANPKDGQGLPTPDHLELVLT
jgi:hypothetical protein